MFRKYKVTRQVLGVPLRNSGHSYVVAYHLKWEWEGGLMGAKAIGAACQWWWEGHLGWGERVDPCS